MLPEGLYEQVISKALDKKLSEDSGIKYDIDIPNKACQSKKDVI